MTLTPGARIGPYEITAHIGAGGMGEVYRARDTRLDRDVAIEVLRESVVVDPGRVARFEREARTLASLNHPNIAQIFVRPFPASAGQWQVSTSGGIWPRWRADGKELYYIAPDGTLMAVPIAVTGATLNAGVPVALFQTRIVDGGTNPLLGWQYDVAPDGRFLINIAAGEGATPITLILNWRAGAQN